MAQPTPHPFDRLDPQAVLDLLAEQGFAGDGRLLALNSYENRVFQVGLEDGRTVVAKFYRPSRWRDAQILEEHAFAQALAEAELPVVAPLPLHGPGAPGPSLGIGQVRDAAGAQDFRIAVYPRQAGQAPELDQPETLRWLGRFIARLHAVGGQQPFEQRRTLDVVRGGQAALDRIEALDILPPAQAPAWADAARRALDMAASAWARQPWRQLRLHGDCHAGNILWQSPADERPGAGPHIVDLDDAVNGPAVQDLWMWLSGSRDERAAQLAQVLQGYRVFRAFDPAELALIEPLRTLRMLHHSAWIAERWQDPAFPRAFPWFGTPAYWGQQTTELREQLEAMTEPPLPDWADDVDPFDWDR